MKYSAGMFRRVSATTYCAGCPALVNNKARSIIERWSGRVWCSIACWATDVHGVGR